MFVRNDSKSSSKYTEKDLNKILEILIDNIFVHCGGRVFHQTVGIPLGTNCAPLLVDLFLHAYKDDFLADLIRKERISLG